LLKVSYESVGHYENGRRELDASKLYKITELGVNINWLLGKVNILDLISFLKHLGNTELIPDADKHYYTLDDEEPATPAALAEHVILGIPITDPSNILLRRIGFVVSYDIQNKLADWVSYKLKKEWIESSALMDERPFNPDPDIPSEYSQAYDDYTSSGYDRGHLARQADMRGRNIYCEFESCFLSNIAPQLPGLNRSTWLVLENRVQDWAVEYDSVWVVTGPIFDGEISYIGDNQIPVPTHFYKIVVRLEDSEWKMMAFVLAQEAESNEVELYLTTIDFIEEKTEIDFFHELADEFENQVESETSELWALTN